MAVIKKGIWGTKYVTSSHVSRIINFPLTNGTNVGKVQEFYDKLTRSYDALEALGESEILKGFVLTTLNKLPHIKSDIVRADDSWEEWGMKDLIDNIHDWLKRNKIGDSSKPERSFTKREKHWFMQKANPKQSVTKEPRKPICLFCEKDHCGDTCTEYDTLEKLKNYFVEHKLWQALL